MQQPLQIQRYTTLTAGVTQVGNLFQVGGEVPIETLTNLSRQFGRLVVILLSHG